MTRYTWTTEKGARVEMVVKTVTLQDTIDGDAAGTTAVKLIDSLTIDGTAYDAEFGDIKGQDAATFKVGRQVGAVILPDDVVEALWGDERRAEAARTERAIKAEADYQAHRDRMRRAMQG